jgi:curved DNA-binding protein CbpA
VELRDLFADLELGLDATGDEVKAAFRRLAQLHHPDKNPGEPHAAHERMVIVQTAYEVLCIDEARALHRQALLSHRDRNRLGNGAVLTDAGWAMPGTRQL